MRAHHVIAALIVLSICLPSVTGAVAREDIAGWNGARWGMTAADIRGAFGEALTELPGRREYKNAHAELALLRHPAFGMTFDVYFQMNADTGRLQQVLLETGRGRAGPRDFLRLRERLEDRYGAPARVCVQKPEDGTPASADALWRFPTTTVHAVFLDFYSTALLFHDPNVDIDPLVPDHRTRTINPRFLPRRIVLRYHPSERRDLYTTFCPPPDVPGRKPEIR